MGSRAPIPCIQTLLDIQLICCNYLVIFIRNFNQIGTIAKIVIANCIHFDGEKDGEFMAQMSIKDDQVTPILEEEHGFESILHKDPSFQDNLEVTANTSSGQHFQNLSQKCLRWGR